MSRTSDQQQVRMFRKSVLALAAVAALGAAALARFAHPSCGAGRHHFAAARFHRHPRNVMSA